LNNASSAATTIRDAPGNQIAPALAPSPSPTASSLSDRPSDVFYERAMRVYNAAAARKLPQRLHLIRVPKAGSTATSVIARRLVGCTPAGPCCQYPGTPRGTCPQRGLMCPNVVGCTEHHAHMSVLMNPEIPSLMVMRHPVSRALSAFFYPGMARGTCLCIAFLPASPLYDVCFAALSRTPQACITTRSVGFLATSASRSTWRPTNGETLLSRCSQALRRMTTSKPACKAVGTASRR
jgi:hypothetical protein